MEYVLRFTGLSKKKKHGVFASESEGESTFCLHLAGSQ